MAKCVLFVIILAFCLALTVGQKRKVSFEVNPGCGNFCKNKTSLLVHVAAEGERDTLHHIWDFYNKPSIILALTPKWANVSIDWELFLQGGEGSVKFSAEPKYIFSFTVDKIIEYNDVNNTGQYNPHNDSIAYVRFVETKHLNWSMIEYQELKNGVIFTISGTDSKTEPNGTIQITLSAYGNKDHSDVQPHLLHTSNSTQVDVVLNKLKTHFDHSRFALSVIVVNTNKDHELNQFKRRTLDDEHSPGVFTFTEVLTAETEGLGGYLQWRTIAYTSPDRIMTNSTEVADSKAVEAHHPVQLLMGTCIYSLLGEELKNLSVHVMFISFGSIGDDRFYAKSNYLSWTLLVGVGHPAEEKFSLLVVLILSIGLGLPAILIILGTICIIARRIARTRNDIITQ